MIIIFDPLERALRIISFTLFLVSGMIYIDRGRKKEVIEVRRIIEGCGVFILAFLIGRIFFFLSDFYAEGNYIGHVYYGSYGTNLSFRICTNLGHISWMLGADFFIFMFEKNVKKTKYILTIMGIFFTFIFLFEIHLFYLSIAYAVTLLIMILIWLSTHSSYEVRSFCAYLSVGIFFILMGSFSSTAEFKVFNSMFPALPPTLDIIGILIIISPNFLSSKIFKRKIRFWMLLIVIIISFFLILFLVLYPLLPEYFRFYFIFSVIPGIITVSYGIAQIFGSYKREEAREEDKFKETKDLDFFKMFTRPDKVTNEDIIFHKEQKICLVCKGKINRFTYICPGCDALYCHKCAETIMKMENACWYCEAALDKSKPVNLPEKKDETLELTEKLLHKGFKK